MKYFIRLLLLPFGLIRGSFKIANSFARDIENKWRFAKVKIEDSCCFTMDTIIGEKSKISEGTIINHSNIGKFSYCGKNCIIQNASIGNYCSFANEVNIGLGAHPLHMFSTSPIFYRINNPLNIKLVSNDNEFNEFKKIQIGSDVWIGSRAIILDGVKIGNGAVVAAGAIVTKDVPPYAIIAGVPAKVLKYRFDKEVRIKLDKTKWWLNTPGAILSQKDHLNGICDAS